MQTGLQNAIKLLDSSVPFFGEITQERLQPFFVRDVKSYTIQLKLSESIYRSVSTDVNGRFYENITINSLSGLNVRRQIIKYIAFDSRFNEYAAEGTIYLMKNKKHGGCSIISDIDDTIKISEVPYKTKLLINTFTKRFEVVPGNFSFQSFVSINLL